MLLVWTMLSLCPSSTSVELMTQARSLYEALEYDQVIPLTQEVLAAEGVDIEMRLDAFLLQGSSLAIVGNSEAAESAFRFLLRGRPTYELDAETPPKILAVFRKVQAEEQAIVEDMRQLERKRILKELKVSGADPASGVGGQPINFKYSLRDPHAAVHQLSVKYRKAGELGFSALSLRPDEQGAWSGRIPAEWTANNNAYTLQYYVALLDDRGATLMTLADETTPRSVRVDAGQLETQSPLLESTWFWVAASAVVVASSAAGYVIYRNASDLPSSPLGEFDLR